MHSIEETFTCSVDKLATERALMPRTLIYCRTFEECSDIYLLFRRIFITPRRWKVNHDMFEYDRNDSKCVRDELFTDVDSYCHEDMGTKCLCCDICSKLCDCGLCESKLSKFTFFDYL